MTILSLCGVGEQVQAPSDRRMRRAWLAFGLIALGVLICDQLSKYFAVTHLTEVHFMAGLGQKALIEAFLWHKHPFPTHAMGIVPGCFDLRYIENPGAAWGFLSRSAPHIRTPLFLAISVMSMMLVIGYFRRTQPAQRAVRLALSLVFGGAIGNFADRIRLGYVVDFIDWHIAERYHWPTFNVADAAITIGALLLIFDMLRHPPRPRATVPES